MPSDTSDDDITRRKSLLSRRSLFLGTTGTIASVVGLSELYSRGFPRLYKPSLDISDLPQTSREGTLTIIFHGAGGPDAYTAELVDKLSADKSNAVYFPDWTEFSSNTLRAASDGLSVGNQIGLGVAKRLGDDGDDGPGTVHVIGISVGSFAAQAVVDAISAYRLRQGKLRQPFLQVIFLDPFIARGVYDWGYGKERFGRGADTAFQYLNTDDPVPFTDQPLANCRTIDVTSIRPEEIFGHDWPLVYYARSKEAGKIYELK
eukprot:CAMPEP_0113302780 /NCGR_PEP_ID=MMETSP0010_2-20120614/3466_1 /TAXON_ID=216773 ORGANISM="Corethron hystrix, Strain 308" /NCGR_SAMPLE_ID=MMETSP0010_2 /ASSEMBLY_ACC=CAM_ASM_000155 /LENGTH=260 /DNA_ID=CAMNT_0000156659 /DNA_START=188 /DNA_END=970 /DNA_ORIENTATION=- /assembly_acc=CAM_ASM_000155